MKGGSKVFVLVAALIGLPSLHAQVGVNFFGSLVENDCNPDTGCSSSDEAVEQKVINSLQLDSQVSVVDVNIGTLVCASLDGAESETRLRLAISPTQTLTADRTSFTVQDGGALIDGLDRKIWLGTVVDPAPVDDNFVSSVSMTWTSPCSLETFLLTVITPNEDGTRSIVKSVPCAEGSRMSACVVEMSLDLRDEAEPLDPSSGESAAGRRFLRQRDRAISDEDARVEDIRLLHSYLSAANKEKELFHEKRLKLLDGDMVLMPSGRKLSCSTQVDLMILYTDEALAYIGLTGVDVTDPVQVNTFFATQNANTNEAMDGSGIHANINLVHVGPLPYEQANNILDEINKTPSNGDLAALRSVHSADLVQIVGFWDPPQYCGVGWLFSGASIFGFSVTTPNCYFQWTHTHEMGHNCGAFHNRENSTPTGDYSHGYRYCQTGGYRTVMSYTCPSGSFNAPRVNLFSNPDVQYNGLPTGVAFDGTNGGSAADNARTLSENMLVIANFESQASCTAAGLSCTSAAQCCIGTCSDAGVCEAVGCSGDPHLVGFRGQKFDFTGEDGLWFALVSDGPCHQTNIRITAPVPDTPEITYITAVALSLCDVEGNSHTMEITVKEPHVLGTECPDATPCLADGALEVTLDGVPITQPSQVNLAKGVEFSAVNLPGPCRSFGFEKYWLAKQAALGEDRRHRQLEDAEPVEVVPMPQWILSDSLQTNPEECQEYVAQAVEQETLFTHQSEHSSMQITSPALSMRISHGKVHQLGMRDPTDQFDLPDHIAFQMNIVFEKIELGPDPQGLVGETVNPVIDAEGRPIMHGLDAIRGEEGDYRVSGPFGHEFPQLDLAGRSWGIAGGRS